MVMMPSELGFHRPFLPAISSILTPETIAAVPAEDIAALFEDEFRAAFNSANELIHVHDWGAGR